jgi:hypothetical protein
MRRALVVGIDDYPRAPLKGCVNDADAMAALLARHADGSPNFDVQRLTSDSASITRGNLLANIQRLFGHDDADVALLYFSGHGTENNLDGYLVTPDAGSDCRQSLKGSRGDSHPRLLYERCVRAGSRHRVESVLFA